MSNIQDKAFLNVELINTFDIMNQKHVEERNVKVDIPAIHEGLIKHIGVTEFVVLLTIASFCDKDKQGFPSQRKLVELTGLSLPTVNRVVNKLLETKINGNPILYRKFEMSSSRKKFSVYTVNAIDVGADAEGLSSKKTAKDFVSMFKAKYEETYGIGYVVNYGRDTALVKNKLMTTFSDEQIEQIFDYIFENYRDKWAKANYPYPTITMACTWLGTVVAQQLAQQDNEIKEAEAIQTLTEAYKESDYSDFDNL